MQVHGYYSYWIAVYSCLFVKGAFGWIPATHRISDFSHARRYASRGVNGHFGESPAANSASFSNALVYYQSNDDPKGRSLSFQEKSSQTVPLQLQAAQETFNWCAHFVVPHNLCPWAAQSVGANQAIRIYVVNDKDSMTKALTVVSQQFYEDLTTSSVDPNTAIAFVVMVTQDSDSQNYWSFQDYYDWYVEQEDDWLDAAEDDEEHTANFVIWAPFHPGFQFEGDDERLQFEKQSPCPTVSIVSSAVIDAAGPATTALIAKNNQEILRKKTVSQWQELYDASVRLSKATKD